MLRYPVGLMLVAMITDWVGLATIHGTITIAKLAFFVVYTGFFLLLAFELVRRRRQAP
jgi:uncharacterized membrane protein YtjA (UPF0391 family)